MTKAETARGLFLEGYNCAQSVAGAYAKEMGMDIKTVARMVSSFGGGMGRLREVCGAVSGMFFVIGVLYGYDDPKAYEAKKELYGRIQHLAGQFKKETGSIICREMLGAEGKDTSAVPGERTPEYYKKRPCPDIIALAAGILEEYLACQSKDSVLDY